MNFNPGVADTNSYKLDGVFHLKEKGRCRSIILYVIFVGRSLDTTTMNGSNREQNKNVRTSTGTYLKVMIVESAALNAITSCYSLEC